MLNPFSAGRSPSRLRMLLRGLVVTTIVPVALAKSTRIVVLRDRGLLHLISGCLAWRKAGPPRYQMANLQGTAKAVPFQTIAEARKGKRPDASCTSGPLEYAIRS